MMKQEGRKGSVMYKSQLQEYAQKAAIPPPVYEFVKEGASHEPRFKAIVILNNVTYESPPGFPNLKSAEHAAAKAALDGLLQTTGGTGVTPSPVHESGLCKNLLQEYAQKNSLPLPVYQSQRSGEDHAPTFTSSVEIAGVKYSGGSAKNKKEAEIKAARTALLAIQSAQSSAPAPAPAPTPTLAPETPATQGGPQGQVGLATYITANLSNNGTGKKRGRGAANAAAADEPNPGRLKYTQTPPQAASQAPPPEVPVKAVTTPTVAVVEKAETPAVSPLVISNVPEVSQQPVTSPVTFSSVDIANLFATPGAKKILGVDPVFPHADTFYMSQETSLASPLLQETSLASPPGQTTGSCLMPLPVSENSAIDSEGTSITTVPDRIADEVDVKPIIEQEVQQMQQLEQMEQMEQLEQIEQIEQIELVNAASEQMKEDQAFMQAAQSSGLISLTG